MRPMLALLLVGCNPHDAEVEGGWTVWLAANSSPTVSSDAVDLTGASRIDCAHVEGDYGYIGSSDDAVGCDSVDALNWQTWLQDDGYYRLSNTIEPWRTDALINGEGDLQLTVHQRLGDGADFRFAFSIDPDFSPTNCVDDDEGNRELEYVDGSDWVTEWSSDEGDYNVYYLNAGAYQINPGDTSETWSFTSDWISGMSYAKFGEDDLFSYGVDYSWYDPDFPVYMTCKDFAGCVNWRDIPAKLEQLESQGVNTRSCDTQDDYAYLRLFYYENWYNPYCEDVPSSDVLQSTVAQNIEDATTSWSDEMTQVYGADQFELRVEDNAWRPLDDTRQGLDGWVDLQTSWVRFTKSSDLEVGGSAEGDFQIYYYGAEAGTHMVIHGTFTIDKIKGDRWAYSDLETEQREENGTEYCGGATVAQ